MITFLRHFILELYSEIRIKKYSPEQSLILSFILVSICAFVNICLATPAEEMVEIPDYDGVVFIEEKALRIERITVPETGITIVTIGKGGAQSTEDDKLPGFQYIKLGTGYDAEGYITGERYVYGPNMGLYLGAHYTDVYEERWCGDGWYKPDGTVYYQNVAHILIPDPKDHGQPYWCYYNVLVSYNPMPTAMRQAEGQWLVKFYDNYNFVAMKNFTVMYKIVGHATCQSVEGTFPNNPVGIKAIFYKNDPYCVAWMRFNNYAMNYNPDVKWMWYGPSGFYNESETSIADPGVGAWHNEIACWNSIPISGQYPANNCGKWYVDVYVKDHLGVYEKKLRKEFFISSITTPAARSTFDSGSDGWIARGYITPFNAPATAIFPGSIGLSPDGSSNCFSYWYSSDIPIPDDRLWGLYLHVGSTSSDPNKTVQFRSRVNQKGSWQSWNSVVPSNNYKAPSYDNSKCYASYLKPDVTGTEDNKVVLNFDILSFDVTDDLNSWIYLDEITLGEVPFSTTMEVRRFDFSSNTEGWTYAGPIVPYVPPLSSYTNGKLGLNPNGSTSSFSYWSSPDVSISDSKVYRTRYGVTSSVTDPDKAVQFRCRINQKGSWQAWDRVVVSNLQQAPASSQTKTYEVFFQPEVIYFGENAVTFSFDIMSFDWNDDINSWLFLDYVALDEIVITP